AAERVREPLAPAVLERRALTETARAFDSWNGPRYGSAGEGRAMLAVRQVQVGDHNDDLAHPRYRTAADVHARTGHAPQPAPRLLGCRDPHRRAARAAQLHRHGGPPDHRLGA